MKLISRAFISNQYFTNSSFRSLRTYSGLNQNENIEPETHSESIKEKILKSSLPYVPNYGWTKESLAAGARDCGFPTITNGLFLNGGADLVHYFHSNSNEKLEEDLKSFVSNNERVSDKAVIKTGVETKLQLIVPYLNKWPQAMALTLLPHNIPMATRNLSKMINCICFYAGYKELNTLWYIRRLSITSLYKTSELYLLQDKSIGQENTWKYLDNAIKRLELTQDKISQLEDADKVMSGAFITVKNMLGLNHI